MFYNYKDEPLPIQGMYSGQSVFLFGGGRSITKQHIDMARLPGIVTMSFNEPAHYIRPNLYLANNEMLMPYSVLHDPTIQKFVPEYRKHRILYEDKDNGKQLREHPNVVLYKSQFFNDMSSFSSKATTYKQKPNATYAHNTIITGIDILDKLGFDNIYLVGADFYEGTGECTYFFSKSYFRKIRGALIGKVINSINKLSEMEGVNIYNTNPRSKLDIPYIDFQEAIDKSKIHYELDTYDTFTQERSHWSWKKYRERLKRIRRERKRKNNEV